MLKIRTVTLSVVLVLILAGAIYFGVAASPAAISVSSTAPTCPVVHESHLSTQELRDTLNGRYERRVGLPY